MVRSIYKAFNSRSFLSVAFIDIRNAYDSVHDPTLISILKSYKLPIKFINFVADLLSNRELTFCAPSGDSSTRHTYTGLPQGSCLSPILLNIYMSVVARSLEDVGIPYFIYADDIVIFYIHKDISITTDFMNNALNVLNNKLDSLFLFVAPKKS